jgi:hypothetical protein
MRSSIEIESVAQWWGERRLRYNIALVLAGLGAFAVYAALVSSFSELLYDAQITPFTVVLQAVAYLIAMGVANMCYFLGPISERVLKPANVNAFRLIAYNSGLWFSVLLPFTIPATIAYVIIIKSA